LSSPELVVYTDGAARGNPGPGGAGVAIEDRGGASLAQAWRYLGAVTNNVAEYEALCLGLEHAAALGARRIEVRADSELIVRQMRGEYRVRNPGLRTLFARACKLAARFEQVGYVHVPREKNRVADRLANLAIDRQGAGQRAGPGPESE
jgi:ribonuclease HI